MSSITRLSWTSSRTMFISRSWFSVSNYKRVVRRGLDSVRLELYLVSIGHNLYKYFNRHYRLRKAA